MRNMQSTKTKNEFEGLSRTRQQVPFFSLSARFSVRVAHATSLFTLKLSEMHYYSLVCLPMGRVRRGAVVMLSCLT